MIFQLFSNLAKEILAPKLCCHCDTFFTFLCENCYQQIDFSFSNSYLQQQLLKDNLYIDQAITVGSFQGPLKSLVLSLKYGGQIEVAQTLANLAYHSTQIPTVDLVTAVPAHQKRISEFGFNQSQLLAQHLAASLNIPFVDLLKRSQKLDSQASIADKKERKARQLGSMTSISQKLLGEKKVLIVDDVFTTGATLNEAARVLKEELSAALVIGFAFAQA